MKSISGNIIQLKDSSGNNVNLTSDASGNYFFKGQAAAFHNDISVTTTSTLLNNIEVKTDGSSAIEHVKVTADGYVRASNAAWPLYAASATNRMRLIMGAASVEVRLEANKVQDQKTTTHAANELAVHGSNTSRLIFGSTRDFSGANDLAVGDVVTQGTIETATAGNTGQATITLNNVSSLSNGDRVTGTGVPAGTFVKSIDAVAKEVTLGDNATPVNANLVNLTENAAGAYTFNSTAEGTIAVATSSATAAFVVVSVTSGTFDATKDTVIDNAASGSKYVAYSDLSSVAHDKVKLDIPASTKVEVWDSTNAAASAFNGTATSTTHTFDSSATVNSSNNVTVTNILTALAAVDTSADIVSFAFPSGSTFRIEMDAEGPNNNYPKFSTDGGATQNAFTTGVSNTENGQIDEVDFSVVKYGLDTTDSIGGVVAGQILTQGSNTFVVDSVTTGTPNKLRFADSTNLNGNASYIGTKLALNIDADTPVTQNIVAYTNSDKSSGDISLSFTNSTALIPGQQAYLVSATSPDGTDVSGNLKMSYDFYVGGSFVSHHVGKGSSPSASGLSHITVTGDIPKGTKLVLTNIGTNSGTTYTATDTAAKIATALTSSSPVSKIVLKPATGTSITGTFTANMSVLLQTDVINATNTNWSGIDQGLVHYYSRDQSTAYESARVRYAGSTVGTTPYDLGEMTITKFPFHTPGYDENRPYRLITNASDTTGQSGDFEDYTDIANVARITFKSDQDFSVKNLSDGDPFVQIDDSSNIAAQGTIFGTYNSATTTSIEVIVTQGIPYARGLSLKLGPTNASGVPLHTIGNRDIDRIELSGVTSKAEFGNMVNNKISNVSTSQTDGGYDVVRLTFAAARDFSANALTVGMTVTQTGGVSGTIAVATSANNAAHIDVVVTSGTFVATNATAIDGAGSGPKFVPASQLDTVTDIILFSFDSVTAANVPSKCFLVVIAWRCSHSWTEVVTSTKRRIFWAQPRILKWKPPEATLPDFSPPPSLILPLLNIIFWRMEIGASGDSQTQPPRRMAV